MIKDGGKLIDFSSKNRDSRVRRLERLLLVVVDLYVRGFGIVLKKVHVRKKRGFGGQTQISVFRANLEQHRQQKFSGKGGGKNPVRSSFAITKTRARLGLSERIPYTTKHFAFLWNC